jgi:hypothetical protein
MKWALDRTKLNTPSFFFVAWNAFYNVLQDILFCIGPPFLQRFWNQQTL